jgi:hypothetical protein
MACTHRSDAPFVFCHDSQMFFSSPSLTLGGMKWLKTSISPNLPRASAVLTKPGGDVAGVAKAFLAQRAVATVAALSNITHVSLGRILTSFFSQEVPDGDARTQSDTLEATVKR